MKQTLTIAIAAVLLMASSCKDNDKEDTPAQDSRIFDEDGKKGVEDEQLSDLERQQLAWQDAIMSVLETLTGNADVLTDYSGVTFEPIYGEAKDEAQPHVRYAKCADAEQAQSNFFAIVGGNGIANATADGYEVSLKDMPLLPDGGLLSVGTLTFHKGNSPDNIGYIDIDIPCIPTLSRIQYVTEEAWGDNASNQSPYKPGDIIEYYSSGSTYCTGYYLCVRACSNSGLDDGILVHMAPGEPGGDESYNLDGDNVGCWVPYNRKYFSYGESEVKAYLAFINDNKKGKLERAKKFLNGEIEGNKPSRQGKLWHILPGDFNNDVNSGKIYTGSKPASIVYGARFGSYAWVPAYDYRHSHEVHVPSYCAVDNLGTVTTEDYKYVKDSSWKSHAGYYNFFTINIIKFTRAGVNGAIVVYTP